MDKLGVYDFVSLSGNPIIGSSWESFVFNHVLAVKPDGVDLYFYRTHQGTEVDLVFYTRLNSYCYVRSKIFQLAAAH